MLEQSTVNDIKSVKSPLRVELSEKLFCMLSEVLNEVHSTSFSVRFWKILLENHVIAVISRKEVLDKQDVFRDPDLIAINGYTFPSGKEKFIKKLIRVVKYYKGVHNKFAFKSALKNQDELLMGFPGSEALETENLGHNLPYLDKLYIGFGEKNKRNKVKEIADQYEDIYLRNVVRELPKNLVEYFINTYKSVPIHNPEAKTFHVHLTTSLYHKFVLAKYIENGAMLYWYQHGSEYGEFKCYYEHTFSCSVSDQFHTWGWKIKENDVPGKAYRLESFREKYDGYEFEPRYKLLICYPAFSPDSRALYRDFSDRLFKGVDIGKYDKILARPRRSNKIHSHASQLSFITDKRVEVSSGLEPMMKEMKMCDLVFQINVPSTNFLECLYVDHPTVGILNNDQPTDIVSPYYNFFKEQGVLHDNIDSLIDHLNGIDIQLWWRELIQKQMYQSYKHTFARDVKSNNKI